MTAPTTPPPAGFGDDVLDPLQTPDGVNLADTGKNILEALNGFTDRLGDNHLGYLYARWQSHPCAAPDLASAGPSYGHSHEESSLLPQLYGLGFGYFDGAAKRLDNLGTAADALAADAGTLNRDVSTNWTDQAGQAVAGKFADLQTATHKYEDGVKKLAAAMHSFWSTTRAAVAQLSQVLQSGAAGRLMAEYGVDVPGVLFFAEGFSVGVQSAHLDLLDEAAFSSGNLYSVGGLPMYVSPISPIVLRDVPGLRLGSYNGHTQFSNEVCNALDDFAHTYSMVVKSFRAQIIATCDLVRSQLEALEHVAHDPDLAQDAFANLLPPQPAAVPAAAPPASAAPPAPAVPASAPAPAVTTTSSVGRAPAAPAMPSAPVVPSTPAMPSTPAVPPPTPAPIPATPPVGAPPVSTPSPTPAPAPTTPQSTMDTLTVRAGDRTITMANSAAQGELRLTLADGQQQPSNYTIDLGQVASGKAVIQEGKLTITAQEAGPTGGVTVTVDDGSGTPTTYTLDNASPTPATAPPAPTTVSPAPTAADPNTWQFRGVLGSAEGQP